MEAAHRLLQDARRQLQDATAEVGRAVTSLEDGRNLDAARFLGEATSRLGILDGEIERYLEGSNPQARSTGSMPPER